MKVPEKFKTGTFIQYLLRFAAKHIYLLSSPSNVTAA